MKKYLSKIFFGVLVLAFIIVCCFNAPVTSAPGTLWSILPAVVAIGLALITKEVYSSLFLGIITAGALFAVSSGSGFQGVFDSVIRGGLITSLSNQSNVGILIFLVVLGSIVVMMNKAGGSRAYGEWASKHISTRKSAGLAAFFLGVLIFVDDYFNCLTVGSVMRPVTDKHNISRAKLAYLIDSTAAPVCIIAPISSWAAAVSTSVENTNGIELFIHTIPYNLYAILTLIMVLFITVTDFDFGPMKTFEDNARKGDLFTTRNRVYPQDESPVNKKSKVIDLILPVIILIVLCISGMLYTGGLFSGKNFVDAFAECDASLGLVIGSTGALILIIFYFLCRKSLTFTECMNSISDGFKQMVPAILILTFAWTLKILTGEDYLNAPVFVSALVESTTAMRVLLPLILFAVAIGLSFATGTSWGTFGILIPIVVSVFTNELAGVAQGDAVPPMVIICISACLAGAVCGDHCSPISDTTIMASTGAQCDHVNHVSTQLPYAFTVAVVCAAGYLISGFIQNSYVVLGVSTALLLAVLFALKKLQKN